MTMIGIGGCAAMAGGAGSGPGCKAGT